MWFNVCKYEARLMQRARLQARAPTQRSKDQPLGEISSASEFWILRTSQRASTRRYLPDFQGQFANYSRVLPFSVTWQISPSSPLIITVHSNKVSKRNELFIAVDPYGVHRFPSLASLPPLSSRVQRLTQPLSLSLFILRSLMPPSHFPPLRFHLFHKPPWFLSIYSRVSKKRVA